MAWDHNYRPLEEGEIILPTDECQPCNHNCNQGRTCPARKK